MTAALNLAEKGLRAQAPSRDRTVFHTMHKELKPTDPKSKEPHQWQIPARVRLYDSAIQLLKSSDRSSLASGLLNAGTKLHGNVLNFSAARTKSNGSDDGCDDDSALHVSLLMVAPKSLYLTRYLRCGGNVRAKLHGHRLLAAACCEGYSGNDRRDYNHALDVHGLLS